MSRLPIAAELDNHLFYVPTVVRRAADTTTLNLFKIMYKIARATCETEDELEQVRQEILNFTAKLEAAARNNKAGATLNDYEEKLFWGLAYTSIATLGIAITSYAAGFILLPIIAPVVCWASLAPFLNNPDRLARKLRDEFDTPVGAAITNTANRFLSRGEGFFNSLSNMLTPRADRDANARPNLHT